MVLIVKFSLAIKHCLRSHRAVPPTTVSLKLLKAGINKFDCFAIRASTTGAKEEKSTSMIPNVLQTCRLVWLNTKENIAVCVFLIQLKNVLSKNKHI